MDVSCYHTAIARLVKCGTQVSQTVGRDQISLVLGKSGWHMHRSDNGQSLVVHHNISLIETKIDSVNIQLRFIPTLHACTHTHTHTHSICVLLQYISANM